jgi:hypothetical protein
MKNRLKLLSCILLFIAFSFSYSIQVSGQEKVNISAGIGLPELLNISVRYQLLYQVQIGLEVGTMPGLDEGQSLTSIGGDIYYHFGRLSKRRPWYFRVGLTNLNDEYFLGMKKYLYLNLRGGKDFNLSKKIGINIDAGLGFELTHRSIATVIPSLGICFFYRI